MCFNGPFFRKASIHIPLVFMCNRNAIDKEYAIKDNPPKVNWEQHATALEKFSCQYKFLSSNFLFSLPTQKPHPEINDKEMLSTR